MGEDAHQQDRREDQDMEAGSDHRGGFDGARGARQHGPHERQALQDVPPAQAYV